MKPVTAIEIRSAQPIERRDEDGGLAAAIAAVEELRTAVDGHRTATDERITTELRALTTRLDEVETRAARPGRTENADAAADLTRRAFNAFIRTGREVMEAEEVRALRVGDDESGGYLANPEFVTEMIRNLVEISPVRQLARVGTTSRGSVILPKLTAVTNAKWTAELAEADESEPTFGQVEIPVHEMTTYTDVSNKLLEDSEIDIAAELAMAFAEDFGRKEAIAFISGDGAGKPSGFMMHAGIGEVLNGHATQLKADALIDVIYDLPAFYRARGAWSMNGRTIAAARKLKATDGHYLWRDSLAEGSPATLIGLPVVETPDMPDIASGECPIAFGAFADAYRIYDRVNLAVLRDPFSMAKKGLVRFHARRRVGGAVVKAEALRKLKMA